MTSIISEKPKVSVVFPAYNEEMYLPLMLWTLSKLKTPLPIEIIGVNNASTDRTGEIITESGIIRIDELRKGVSYARQAGLEASKGKIIATTDADTQVPETWIDANIKYFEQDPELVCFSGGSKMVGMHPMQHIIRIIPRTLRFIRGHGYLPKSQNSFGGANTFFRKSTANSIGGYALGFDLGEDILIAQKMQGNGNMLMKHSVGATVITSNRRFDSGSKVLFAYWNNFLHSNWMNNKVFVVDKSATFRDIR